MTEKLSLNLILFLSGISVGSFLNVCIYRIPEKMSIWQGRSRCPHCGQKIRWFHLFPVLSYIFLKGRCHSCGKKISWHYPFIELFSGIWTVFLFHLFGWTHSYWVNLTFSWLLLIISVIDLKIQRIPNSLIIFGLSSGVLLNLQEPDLLLQMFMHGFISGLAIWMLSFLNKVITGKDGFGGGDVKLVFLIGFYLGLEAALWSFGIACVLGAIIGIIGLCFNFWERKHRIAFAPFLGIGVLTWLIHKNVVIVNFPEYARCSFLGFLLRISEFN